MLVPHDEEDRGTEVTPSPPSIVRWANSGVGILLVAVQDGPAAGQSVPHVHVHILPRSMGDLERNDDVYDALELWAPREERTEDKSSSSSSRRLVVADDDHRRDRTVEEMEQEAALYRGAAVIDKAGTV